MRFLLDLLCLCQSAERLKEDHDTPRNLQEEIEVNGSHVHCDAIHDAAHWMLVKESILSNGSQPSCTCLHSPKFKGNGEASGNRSMKKPLDNIAVDFGRDTQGKGWRNS